MPSPVASLCPSLLLLALTGCSHADSPAPAAPPAVKMPPPPQAAVPPEPEHPTACALVTPQEMSNILGAAMVADGTDGTSKTRCTYKVATGIGPYVEFTLDRGSADAAMHMARMVVQVKPDLARAYSGIGDEATMVGTTLMIRNGEDLVTLVMSDVNDVPDKAKRVFDTAKARM